MDVLPEAPEHPTMLQAWCERDDCKWRRIAMPNVARALELAGYAHMKANADHAVSLNFTPRRVPSILELVP